MRVVVFDDTLHLNVFLVFFFFNDTATTEIYTLSLHDALPISSIMAKSVKAKMLLYAASPLFNGNSVYTDFKDKEGVALMPASYDAQKWVKARDALAEAIKLAEDKIGRASCRERV